MVLRVWTGDCNEARVMAIRYVVLCPLIVLCLASTTLRAQADATLGLGGGVAFYHPIDADASDSTGFALVYRFGKPEGWGPTFGLNWFTTDFTASIGSARVPLGDLRVRPVMGGYSYTVRRGAFAITAGLVGGYAFNSFEVDDRARLAYQSARGDTLLRITASNSLAGRGEIAMWYDVSSRFGLQGVVGYVAARPVIETITGAGSTSRRLRADSVKLQIGLAYGIF
jgi:hypothetical protein